MQYNAYFNAIETRFVTAQCFDGISHIIFLRLLKTKLLLLMQWNVQFKKNEHLLLCHKTLTNLNLLPADMSKSIFSFSSSNSGSLAYSRVHRKMSSHLHSQRIQERQQRPYQLLRVIYRRSISGRDDL